MITVVTNDWCMELRGLSTDTKPTSNIGNGSVYFEIDTGKVFMFDEKNTTWLEI